MALFEVALLGVIQGLTEFLPVSSSGHLLAARLLLGISDESGGQLDAFLHLGTLLAVLIYFRSVWWGILRGLFIHDQEGNDKRDLAMKIAVATVPAALVGYFGQNIVEEYFRSAQMLSLSLLFTAVVLWWSDKKALGLAGISRVGLRDAKWIGLAQVVALLPGVSRSAVTMAAGRLRGLTRRQAASFSFLLSAPIIAGAGLNGFASLIVNNNDFLVEQLILGFLLSFISGLAAVAVFMKIIERTSFKPFVIYLVLFASLVFIYG